MHYSSTLHKQGNYNLLCDYSKPINPTIAYKYILSLKISFFIFDYGT